MTEPHVVERHLVMIDADGELTDDRDAAVRGEITESMSDGSVRSTLFGQPPISVEQSHVAVP